MIGIARPAEGFDRIKVSAVTRESARGILGEAAARRKKDTGEHREISLRDGAAALADDLARLTPAARAAPKHEPEIIKRILFRVAASSSGRLRFVGRRDPKNRSEDQFYHPDRK